MVVAAGCRGDADRPHSCRLWLPHWFYQYGLNAYDYIGDVGSFRMAHVKTLRDIRVTDGELTLDFAPTRMVRMYGTEVIPSK